MHRQVRPMVEVPEFPCYYCKVAGKVSYYKWESSDGAHEDYHYMCKNCKKDWWFEGSDY